MAEVQEESGEPVPAHADHACMEHCSMCPRSDARCRDGLLGVNMTADPQDSRVTRLRRPCLGSLLGGPRRADLPVHFHIAASQTALVLRYDVLAEPGRLRQTWNRARRCSRTTHASSPSQQRLLPGCSTVTPTSRWSRSRAERIGWVPFMLEAMDYELEENAGNGFMLREALLGVLPGQFGNATFWFETEVGGTSNTSSTPSVRTRSCSRPTSPPDQPALRTRSRW